MTRWRKTVDIKQYLHREGYTDTEDMRAVLTELRRHPEFEHAEAGCLLDEMEEAAEADDVPWFDEVLARAYDVADRERIWMGL